MARDIRDIFDRLTPEQLTAFCNRKVQMTHRGFLVRNPDGSPWRIITIWERKQRGKGGATNG